MSKSPKKTDCNQCVGHVSTGFGNFICRRKKVVIKNEEAPKSCNIFSQKSCSICSHNTAHYPYCKPNREYERIHGKSICGIFCPITPPKEKKDVPKLREKKNMFSLGR